MLKKLRERLSTSVAAEDENKLRAYCADRTGCTPIAELRVRAEASAVGEIRSLRIVPHTGSPWLEATITDGTGSMVVLWTGRRRIAGVAPGRRLIVHGRMAPTGKAGRLMVYNPRYELLAA